MKSRSIFTLGIFFLLSSFLFCFSFKVIKFHQRNKLFHNLGKEISQKAYKAGIEYSLFIKDLSFPRIKLTFDENKQFPAASLIKLPLLAVAFKAIQEGKFFLKQEIVITKKDIVGGSGKLKTMKLPKVLTVQRLLEFMITLSDNTATNKIIELLGFDYINDSFKKWGLSNTLLRREMMDFKGRNKGIENYTSSQDIAYLLEKIYDQKLLDKEFSLLALSFLKKQEVNDRIPRYLPDGVIVAHKTGLEREVVHDAGIVFTKRGNYIICVLVKGAKNYKQAKKFIAESSLLTYNFYK